MTYDMPASLQRLDGTVGIWTFTDSVAAPDAHDVALELERCGFSALWIPEAWGREAFTNAGLLLSGSSTLTIATGIANIYARDAVSASAAAKTLNAAYGDRFVLGLGVSHRPIVAGLRGHDYSTPLAAMEAYLGALDDAPMFAPEGQTRPARVIAALGPKMLEIASRLADGVHPYLVTPAHTATARAIIGEKFIGVEQAVVLGQSREEYLRRAHAHLEIYTGLPNYRNSWRRLGFTDDDFVRGGSDRLCDALVVHGDEAAVLARIGEHRDAGANHVCLQVLGENMANAPIDEWRRIGAALGS